MPESSTSVQQISAEFLGTFVLVFFGCGTALMSGGNYVATALAFGLNVHLMA
jgi:aquaporin Z